MERDLNYRSQVWLKDYSDHSIFSAGLSKNGNNSNWKRQDQPEWPSTVAGLVDLCKVTLKNISIAGGRFKQMQHMRSIILAPVVLKMDNAIHRINLYSLDSAIGFPNTYPLDGDLSGG